MDYKSTSNLKGSASLNYLNQNIEIDYKLENNLVTLKSPENNKHIIKLQETEYLKDYFNQNSVVGNFREIEIHIIYTMQM